MIRQERRRHMIAQAMGAYKAELVIKNADIFNVFTQETEHGDLAVSNGYFIGIGKYEGETEIDGTSKMIVPGFIDGHMHLESSIVTPAQYCKAVIPHGTMAVVADPHELANVCGRAGIDYILNSTEDLPIDIYIMIPSCVPATPFDESGYKIDIEDIEHYIHNDRVLGLAEVMNYPGVIRRDTEVVGKIKAAIAAGKIIDGHAPGLSGYELNAYTAAGVFSDHECTNSAEAIEKLSRGQWIMIREGTACKNLEALLPLCKEPYWRRCLFATDDKHPGDLIKEGHIDHIVRKAIQNGVDPKKAYTIASFNAASYFRLPYTGAICPGYKADFLILNDMESVDIAASYKNGFKLYDQAEMEKSADYDAPVFTVNASIMDTVNIVDVNPEDFILKKPAKVIGLVKNQITTTDEGEADAVDTDKDILKLAVVERHHRTGHIGLCYVKGYGLKAGAVATSVAHDSHNIICAGTNDEDMAFAVMSLKEMRGGMIVVKDKKVLASLELPIAGLMCDLPVEETKEKLDRLKEAAALLGVPEGIDAFMNMSFASLAVIPTIRLTTLGVVDVNKFALV